MENLAELSALVHNMVRIGQIKQIDPRNALVRVQCGDNLSDWLPVPAAIGNNFIAWQPMRLGQTVTLVCPSGDLAQARIVGMGYTTDIPAFSQNPGKDIIQFNDSTRVEYDSGAQLLTLHSAKDIHISTANTMTLSASQMNIRAPITQTGGDMTSDGISAQHHSHPQNSGNHYGGGVDTGEPQ